MPEDAEILGIWGSTISSLTLQALSDPHSALGRFILLLPCAGLGAGPLDPHQHPGRGVMAPLNPSVLSVSPAKSDEASQPHHPAAHAHLWFSWFREHLEHLELPAHGTARAVRGWEGTTGHTALFSRLAVARAGLALSQVDFILQNSCAKVWAALVQGILEGMDTWHEPGSARALCSSCSVGQAQGTAMPVSPGEAA